MPIKTNFLELEKLEGHENYNGDIENSNLDKIDAAVKNNEDRTSVLEDKINKKDQLTVELKSEKKVVSVTDSFGGACGFEIEGALVEQLVENGDFKDTDNWNPIGANNFQVSNGEASFDPVNQYGRIFQRIRTNIQDKIFVYAQLKTDVGQSIGINNIQAKAGTGKYEEIYGILVNSSSEYSFEIFKADTTPNQKIYINGKAGVFVINMTTLGINNYTVDQMLAICRNGYFEGLQPLCGVAIKAIGKNLFNPMEAERGYIHATTGQLVATTGHWSSAFIPVKKHTKYSFSAKSFINQGVGMGWYRYDANKNYIESAGSQAKNLDSKDAHYLKVGTRREDAQNFIFQDLLDGQLQVEEDTTTISYEPHVSSKIVLDHSLAKLPNHKADKIVRKNGKTVKYVETNVGRDGQTYTIKTEDIVDLYTGYSNIDYLRVNRSALKGYKYINSVATTIGSLIIKDFSESISGDIGSIVNVGTALQNASNVQIWFGFTKGTSLNDAKNAVIGTKIAYQLDTPQTIDLTDELEPVNSYDSYTQFSVEDSVIEHEKANFYDSGTYHYFNYKSQSHSHSKYSVKIIEDILQIKNGESTSIIDHTLIEKIDVYKDNIGFAILNADIIKYNIDINQIYITYTTIESNGQANVKLSYNADMSSSVSNNSNAINLIGGQTDYNSKEINKLNEIPVWVEPTLLNNTTNYGAQYLPLQYSIKNRVCKVRGTIRTKDLVKVAKLPAPHSRRTEIFVCDRANSHGRCWIDDKGYLTVVEGDITLSFQYEI